MFWCDRDFMEEEWSLSAKLFAGLVLNPFSSVNDGRSSLINWFCNRVIGSELLDLHGWRAKPEYVGELGRNDWRLQVGKYQVAVECKFGDGIDIYGDCLKYLQGLDPTYRRVVVVASVSEFSELTEICVKAPEQFATLKTNLKAKDVVLLAWHEIVEAAIERLPTEGAKKILKDWADNVNRESLRLMPQERLSGDDAAKLILQGRTAGIPITHRTDARGESRPTSTLGEVCKKRNAPEWVCRYMAAVESACSKGNSVFVSKKAGWVDVKKGIKGRSVTLFPWEKGVAILISHPPAGRQFPGYFHLEQLGLHEIVPDSRNWFPRDRTIGLAFTTVKEGDEQHFVEEIMKALSRL